MKRNFLLLFILIGKALFWAGFSFAQPKEPHPPPRYGATMAEFGPDKVVLFGGQASSGELLDDTWTWNGSGWVKESPAQSPPARVRAGMAFDAASITVVLFGGQGSLSVPAPRAARPGLLNDTWTWDGKTWTLVSIGFPTARFGMALGENAYLGRVVMHGGIDAISGTGETHLWNGTAWMLAFTLNSPGTFEGADIVARLNDTSSLLFGGCGYEGPIDETWSWIDGTTWMQMSVGARPPARCQHSLALNVARQEIVLFGGTDGTHVFRDTWLFTGYWTHASSGLQPSARYGASMAYHADSQRVVLFGGMGGSGRVLGDTWLWNGVWKQAK